MAASNFERAMTIVFGKEGGFSRDPDDPGNWTGGKKGVGKLLGTNMGIAANTYPNEDIAHMTRERAHFLYKRDYWDKAGCDAHENGVDLVLFDLAVNSGVGRACRYASATTALLPDERIRQVCKMRLDFMKTLSTWPKYKNGWTARVAYIEETALRWRRGK